MHKHTQARSLLLQLSGHVCKFCSSAHTSLELLGHEWGTQLKPPGSWDVTGDIQAISSRFARPKEAQGAEVHPKADNGNLPTQLVLLPVTEAAWAPRKCQPRAPSPKAALGLIPCRAEQRGEEVSCSQWSSLCLPFMGSVAGNKGLVEKGKLAAETSQHWPRPRPDKSSFLITSCPSPPLAHPGITLARDLSPHTGWG